MDTNSTTPKRKRIWSVLTVLLTLVVLLQLAILFQRQVMLQRKPYATAHSAGSVSQWVRRHLPWVREDDLSRKPVTPDTVWNDSLRMARMHSRINRMFEEAFNESFRFPLAPAVASSPPTSNGSAPPDPFRRMHDMHREIDALFQEALRDARWSHASFDDGWANLAVTPGMTVKDLGERFEITVSLPDVDKSDIRLVLDGSILTLYVDHSDSRQEPAKAPASGTVASRRISRFEQRIRLPGSDPEPGHVKATLENGILRIVVPKRTGKDYEQGEVKVI